MEFDQQNIDRVMDMMMSQWHHYPQPPPSLLEQRVLELESFGLLDEEDEPGIPSNVRQYALVSLMHKKPSFFVTVDEQMLMLREMIEFRFGMPILSVSEAVMLQNEDPIN